MGTVEDAQAERAAALVDELSGQQRVLAAAQARQAELMVEFAAVRHGLDAQRIADRSAVGIEPRYVPGEFAATEIGLAVKASKFSVSRLMGITRRLQEEAPDVWAAWRAGDLDLRRAAKVNSALLRLTQASSKRLLNQLVVPVATFKTAELLGRWLNQFIAQAEPDQTDERLRRSFADRYVSIRPDVDGISFLSAAVSAVDADAVDQVLNAVAGLAEPGDLRTWAQRRADVLIDLVLGRVSNGCHVTWEDDETDEDADGDGAVEGDDRVQPDVVVEVGEDVAAQDVPPADDEPEDAAAPHEVAQDVASLDEWDLPATAFRPDPRNKPATDSADGPPGAGQASSTSQPRDPERPGRPVITPCPQPHPTRPLPVTIGVIVTVQSLFGYTNTPGQLADRSNLIPADTIRHLAATPGTLFYQLLTDHHGNLLATTELGRYPSRKLGHALTFRDGTCTNPICTTPTRHCDHDHLQPAPTGPTTAWNLDNKCRCDHRAKTHAGHHSTRTTPHTKGMDHPHRPHLHHPRPTPPHRKLAPPDTPTRPDTRHQHRPGTINQPDHRARTGTPTKPVHRPRADDEFGDRPVRMTGRSGNGGACRTLMRREPRHMVGRCSATTSVPADAARAG